VRALMSVLRIATRSFSRKGSGEVVQLVKKSAGFGRLAIGWKLHLLQPKRPSLEERDGRYRRANLGGWLTPRVSVERDETLSDLSEFLRRSSLRTDGPFTLRSGAVSSWYLDARRTTFDGEGAAIVANAVLAVLDERVVAVGGMTMGADPIAMSTAVVGTGLGRTLRAFSIRKQTKDHGVGGRLVGAVAPGDRVAILEDTTTTGGALGEAVDVAIEHGLRVMQAIALVDRSGTGASSLMAHRGVPYVALVRPADLGVDE